VRRGDGCSLTRAAPPRPGARVVGPRRRGTSNSWLLSAYFVGKTILLRNSGLPQFADMFAIGVMTRLRSADFKWVSSRHLPLVLLTVWIAAVNLSWTAYRLVPDYLLFTSYYVFNLLLFTLFATTWAKDPARFRRQLHWATWIAVGVQLAAVTLVASYRANGTFNNPNQLAYFGMCAMSVYMVTSDKPKLRDLLLVGAISYLELKTLSRAGIVGTGFLVALWLRTVTQRPRLWAALLTAAVVGGTVAFIPGVMEMFEEQTMVGELQKRLDARMSAYDEIGLRNVERISQYSTYTVFGAGEGDLQRFAYGRDIEIHSTLGTLLFSYGFLGVSLFLLFLVQLLGRLPREHYGHVLAILLYSATHNGLRFSYGWIVLAVLAGMAEVRSAQLRAAPRTAKVLPPTSDARTRTEESANAGTH
jgi:hypothetical protein